MTDSDEVATNSFDLEIVSNAVKAYFGPTFSTVEAYTMMLAEEGEIRGLIGPRELPRLWSRHVVNCAALLGFLPRRGTVLDVGSGAGLPGIVIAAARPDLEVTLLETMERRCEWLDLVREELGLDNVTIINARAEDVARKVRAEVVTARAVAGLGKLIRITSKLIAPGGKLLALKGRRASEEVEAAAGDLRRYHLDARVHDVVSVMDGEITYVVECVRQR